MVESEPPVPALVRRRRGAEGRRADIQGLRAVAVLVVVCFHAGLPLRGGFVGVDVFFVISGFVIAAMLEREWKRTGRVKFGSFYLRRFKRLTPALASMTGVVVLMSAVLLSPLGPQQTVGKTAIGAMLLVGNVVIAGTTGGYFGTAAEMNPLLHTWSLSVEEQFYIVFPALMVVAWFLVRRFALSLSPLIAVGGVAAVSFALALVGPLDKPILGLSVPISRLALGFYSPLTRAWEFAVGALLALVLVRWRPKSRLLSGLIGVCGVVLVGVSCVLISKQTRHPGVWTLLPVVGTLLLLTSGADTSAPTSRLLSQRPMVRIGDWSYSIYLWHWPFIVFAGQFWGRSTVVLVGAAIASLLPALLSFRWVEQPIRNNGGLTGMLTVAGNDDHGVVCRR